MSRYNDSVIFFKKKIESFLRFYQPFFYDFVMPHYSDSSIFVILLVIFNILLAIFMILSNIIEISLNYL
jgi:hypothetical protein